MLMRGATRTVPQQPAALVPVVYVPPMPLIPSPPPVTTTAPSAVTPGVPPPSAVTSQTVQHAKSIGGVEGDRLPMQGNVRGMRNFKIDLLGRLTGVIYTRAIWVPGVNDARCMRTWGIPVPIILNGFSGPAAMAAVPDRPVDDHEFQDCGHGFYAYWDGSRDYHEKGDVTGVIRGFGTGEIGPCGFRVMKAEIVAIKFSGSIPQDVRDAVIANYPNVPVFKTVATMLAEFPLTNGLEDEEEA